MRRQHQSWLGRPPALRIYACQAARAALSRLHPPQVAYKHMGNCRHVVLASGDRGLVATGANQSSILACEGLGQALELVSKIVDHLDATTHQPGESH